MRAIQYHQIGQPPELVDVARPDCPPDGAVVAVRATGICRSDWHAWRGHDPVPLPMIPGHEFAGVIAAVGTAVTSFGVGDRVTVPFVNGCGDCPLCLSGHAQVCPNQTQPGFTHAGSYAEFVAVHSADFNLVRLPEELDFVTAASLGCRFATAYHALTAQARLTTGEWLVVFGCGGVGLSAVMIAVALGARVIAVDPSPAARARATELGAEHSIDPTQLARLAEVTDGGAQVSIDALGSPATAAAAVACLRRRGRHVQVGLMLGEASNAPLPWDLVVSRELLVAGSHGMAAADYPDLLALITSGSLAPQRLIGRVIDLADAAAELMAMDAPQPAGAGLVVASV
jgi:alcohol dehydrogenase